MSLAVADADFEILEALVLSDQLCAADVGNLMQSRPDFAEWFTQRAEQRQNQQVFKKRSWTDLQPVTLGNLI